ncbi:metabotropic glutamate receptor 6 isoform X1 [Neodiprion pinetum]|uniref:metabotropic glutamate receptor 6 isoform X1 n=1 Tax=Neodiprion pinetum TaxID=441929 RepID=UPI001EDCE861|nr:metabotropic glutamate receptor 6-like isoform X1 [Neodiprion pinetum]XP_046477674.1 metabotropic glutamate receptor 6-like isoform X1 [Neodiprion pinetum]
MTRTRFTLLILLAAATDARVAGMQPYLNMSGDITLGALFPIHRKGSDGEDCGRIQTEDGIQPLEAMLYTLQQINQDPDILPGIKLGALVFDSCDNPSHALKQALYFVKGFIAHVNTYHQQEFHCLDGSAPKFLGGGFDKVVAVLAAQSSSVTIQVASMLRLFAVPQISYMATSPSLSSKDKFPHFFRTVPSDVNQAHAMLEILKDFGWTYVSIVYSDTEYGNHGYETLDSLASNYSICFSAPHRINKEQFSDEDYDGVIRTITNKTEVRVVVLFAEKSTTLRVLEAARRVGVGERFVWIGSDAWSTANHKEVMTARSDELQVDEMTVLEGALAVQPLSGRMSGFDEYFTDLTLDHKALNPWFSEFWEEYHHCDQEGEPAHDNETMPQVSLFPRVTLSPDTSCTSPRLTIEEANGYKQQRFLHFVRDAVYAVAYALHDLHQVRCGKNYTGICDDMRHIDGETISAYLSNVSFNDEAGKKFRFVHNVDGPPRYSILNYQKVKKGSYHWVVIGNYTQDDNGAPLLYIEKGSMKFRGQTEGGREFFPNSTCAQPCEIDQVKFRERLDPCCYKCRNCGHYQVKLGEHRCEDCLEGTRPTPNRTFCEDIPEDFIDYSSPWAIAAMAVASCGILVTLFVLFVFWIYSETPVIKASGRELSSLLLLGTLVSFLMTFAVVAKPDSGTCTITRFGIGLCYTLCYAALVTKTNRIHRIFNNMTHSPHKPRYTSPKSQLIITGLLTSIEVVINAVWLMKVPPSVNHIYPSRDVRLRICRGLEDRSYMVGLIYPCFLIVICTLYAVKTRKCPEGFNETRYIAFTNYTTIILWLAFVPLYLVSTNNDIRVVTLALSLSLSGLVQLACLFFPKVYIVLMKPEKNTKELVMAQHRSSSYLAAPATPVVVLNENGVSSYVHGSDSSIKTGGGGSDASTLNLWKIKPILKDQSITSAALNAKDTLKNLQIRTM